MKKVLTYTLSTLLFNTAIAGVLTLLMPSILFWHNFIYSQCIGLSVMTINVTVAAIWKNGITRWAILSITLPLSVAIGMSLSFAISGVGSWSDSYVWSTMLIGLFFGFIGAFTFLMSERIETEVKQRELSRSESERREVEANLKLLQAQIEPHFLFNTLANVSSLIDTDPALAKRLLARLNDWLRVALARARSDRSTLADELDMLENYLQILKIRFGERLSWDIEVPEATRMTAFPPMLLQPLVENAVRHGIEPKVGGGSLHITARLNESGLKLGVHDDGVGFFTDAKPGAGLQNVRARLAALYGDKGTLLLENNAAGGLTVTLEIPR